MKPFHELSHRGQLGRLRHLAETALKAYDLGPCVLSPLGYVLKCTFRVDALERRYLLRVSPPEPDTVAHVEAEVGWLAELADENGLGVPRPVPTADGALSLAVAHEGVPEPRVCALFEWVGGRAREEPLAAADFERIGAVLGQLHAHGQQQQAAPEGLRRYTWDGVLDRWWQQVVVANPALTQYQWDLLRQTAERSQEVMGQLGEGHEVFGLIHGNFYWGNYLFGDDDIGVIDFDECGRGYFLYDIAQALMGRPEGPAEGDVRAAFVEGYSKERSLPAAQQAQIEDFMAFRTLAWLMEWLRYADHPIAGPRVADFAPAALSQLRGYIED